MQIFNIAFSLRPGLLGVKRLEVVYIFDTRNCSIALQCNNVDAASLFPSEGRALQESRGL